MPALPVIFSTGHADRTRLDDYLEQPNVGYLLKPYERNMLLRAIEDVLPSAESLRGTEAQSLRGRASTASEPLQL
jgi:FixJ family two-component response regulator